MRRSTRIVASVALFAVAVSAMPTITGTPGASATATTPIKVLILGDSYSAGTGGGMYSGPADCFRSANTWGQQLGLMIQSTVGRPVEVTNRACSGAVSTDFYRTRDVGEAHSDVAFTTRQAADAWSATHCSTIGVDHGESEWGDVHGTPLSALRVSRRPAYYRGRCAQWVPAQLDNVNNTYDYVVMTLGGNDAHFSEIGAGCLADPLPSFANKVTMFAYLSAVFGPAFAHSILALLATQARSKAKCSRALDFAENLIAQRTLTARLTGVLHDVDTALNTGRSGPSGQVLLLDYPNLIRNPSYLFAKIAVGQRLATLQQGGAAAEADAATAYDHATGDPCVPHAVLFADATKQYFADHELVAPVGVNGIDLPGLPNGTQADSFLWPINITFNPLGITESAHPTPEGYSRMALAAFDALSSNGLGSSCCPAPTSNSTVLVWNPDAARDQDEGDTLASVLSSAGYDVALCHGALPTDLTPYRAVFHLGAYTGVSPTDATRLAAFVASGKGVLLTGERPCCEILNQSVQSITDAVLSSPPAIGGVGEQDSYPYSPVAVNTNLPSSLTTTPNSLTTWLPAAPGGMTNVDASHAWALSSSGIAVGGVWGPSDMIAGQGRLAVLMDINWIQSNWWDPTTAPAVAANLAYYLAGPPTHAAHRFVPRSHRTSPSRMRRLPQDSTTGGMPH